MAEGRPVFGRTVLLAGLRRGRRLRRQRGERNLPAATIKGVLRAYAENRRHRWGVMTNAGGIVRQDPSAAPPRKVLPGFADTIPAAAFRVRFAGAAAAVNATIRAAIGFREPGLRRPSHSGRRRRVGQGGGRIRLALITTIKPFSGRRAYAAITEIGSAFRVRRAGAFLGAYSDLACGPSLGCRAYRR